MFFRDKNNTTIDGERIKNFKGLIDVTKRYSKPQATAIIETNLMDPAVCIEIFGDEAFNFKQFRSNLILNTHIRPSFINMFWFVTKLKKIISKDNPNMRDELEETNWDIFKDSFINGLTARFCLSVINYQLYNQTNSKSKVEQLQHIKAFFQNINHMLNEAHLTPYDEIFLDLNKQTTKSNISDEEAIRERKRKRKGKEKVKERMRTHREKFGENFASPKKDYTQKRSLPLKLFDPKNILDRSEKEQMEYVLKRSKEEIGGRPGYGASE